MAMQLTPERIAELLLDFAANRLREGATPAQVEQDLINQGAQADVAKLLVSKAVEAVKPT